MLFPTFPEMPAFDALLSGSQETDLLSVLCEAGQCDQNQVEGWVASVASGVSASCGRGDESRLASVATRESRLEVVPDAVDGRVAPTTTREVGWPVTVAALEHRLLREVGVEVEIIAIFEDLLLRLETPSGRVFHPVGSLSVWVDEAVAVGFLAERFPIGAHDLHDLLSERGIRSGSTNRRLAMWYLEALCDGGVLAESASVVARRQMAALDPSHPGRWLDVAEAEARAGRYGPAFELATRLEQSGLDAAAGVRRAAEHGLASLN